MPLVQLGMYEGTASASPDNSWREVKKKWSLRTMPSFIQQDKTEYISRAVGRSPLPLPKAAHFTG
jgi:hypothetical protein